MPEVDAQSPHPLLGAGGDSSPPKALSVLSDETASNILAGKAREPIQKF